MVCHSVSTKRKRSASSASELPILTVLAETCVEQNGEGANDAAAAPSPVQTTVNAKNTSGRVKRGGGRRAAAPDSAGVDGDDGTIPAFCRTFLLQMITLSPTVKKHPNQYTYRGKSAGGNQQRRAPASLIGQSPALGITHDHGTRRGGNRDNNGGASGGGTGSGGGRSSHHYQAYYNATQLPLFASWGLPDYLAHLQSILPSEVPPPLVIRGAVSFFRDGEITTAGEVSGSTAGATSETDKSSSLSHAMLNATGSLSERGVKVKWPAKRMSVADMNKRVRSLLEWVGREQACFSDRERRKEALERELKGTLPRSDSMETANAEATQTIPIVNATASNYPSDKLPAAPSPMLIDGSDIMTDSPVSDETEADGPAEHLSTPTDVVATTSAPKTAPLLAQLSRQSTAKMMEELMEELISFQERFGPGAKTSRDRGGRAVAAA